MSKSDTPKNETAAQNSPADTKARAFTEQEVNEISKHALPIFQDLIKGELRGRDQRYAAKVAFARARAFVEVLREIRDSGELPVEAPRKLAAVSAPNLDPLRFKLSTQQMAMREYIAAGEPGVEVLNKRIKELAEAN